MRAHTHTHIHTQVRAHTHTHLQTHRVICTTEPLSCLGSLTDRARSTSCRFLNVSDNIDGNSMMCNVLSTGETKYIGKATSEKKKRWLVRESTCFLATWVGRQIFFCPNFKKKKESAPIFWCRSGYRRQTIFFFRPYQSLICKQTKNINASNVDNAADTTLLIMRIDTTRLIMRTDATLWSDKETDATLLIRQGYRCYTLIRKWNIYHTATLWW